jgi:hypothetical protein
MARRTADGLHRVVDRLFYTRIGSITVSAIFGFALAVLFQRTCKNQNCRIIKAPPMQEVLNTTYESGDGQTAQCYKYTTSVVPCGSRT